jgi:hypothetical protein
VPDNNKHEGHDINAKDAVVATRIIPMMLIKVWGRTTDECLLLFLKQFWL